MTQSRHGNIALSQIRLAHTDTQDTRRARYDKGALKELANSIVSHGVLQPIIVRPDGPDFQLVAGERRVLAAKMAGLDKIPASIRDLSDQAVIEIQLIENLQRAEVHPMEEAVGYEQLLRTHGLQMEELNARVGKSRSYVYGRLKLLALTAPARKAFYGDKISASIALLLARIPVSKLQIEALKTVEGQTFREARDYIHSQYMLRLRGAPFEPSDPDLVPAAGTCGACPKRTGNQPELFGDVKSADVCTDPVCYRTKVDAAAKVTLEGAKKAGQAVIAGAKAKRVAPYGVNGYHLQDYQQLDARNYSDPKARTGGKCRTYRQMLPADVEKVLLEDTTTGIVHEVVKRSALTKLDKGSGTRATSNPQNEAVKKAKIERKFRDALYEVIRPKLRAPTDVDLALLLWRQMPHDYRVIVARLQGWVPLKKTYGTEYGALAKKVEALRGDDLEAFLNDCLFVPELPAPSWSTSKPTRLLAAAKTYRVNTVAIRRSVTPKRKKKATAKRRTKRGIAHRKAGK